MFEELFTEPVTIKRYRNAPLIEYRIPYLQRVAESGAARRTLQRLACDQLRAIHLLDLKESGRVTISQINDAAKDWSKFVRQPQGRIQSRSKSSIKCYSSNVIRWLRFLGWLEEPPVDEHQNVAEVAAFAAWMRDQRGLAEETIHVYCRMVNEFFDSQEASGNSLASTTIRDVDNFITVKTCQENYRRKTISLYAVSLRAFFRYSANQGWCTPGIAPAIKPPRVYLDEPIPTGLDRVDIRRLLSTTEGNRPADKRDRAILMLLVAYGLRAGEVVGLKLDDLDWEQETLRVRRTKSGRSDLYPLSRGVAQAILRYLLEVRPPRSERTLFLTLSAPIKPLSPGGLGTVVRSRLNRLGIVSGRRGPHAIRHAAAQHLLDQGMSMKMIGDFLGHRKQSSTAIYAKVNLSALREVADFDLEGLA